MANVASKLRFAADDSTTPGTGYQVRTAHESADETRAMSQNVCGSMPRLDASCDPSEAATSEMKSIMLFASFAAMPCVAPPTAKTLPAIGSTSDFASATSASARRA